MAIEKRFIGIKELSEYIGVPVGTIYSWTHMRKIPYLKLGKSVKFDLQELEVWFKKRRIKVYEYKPLDL